MRGEVVSARWAVGGRVRGIASGDQFYLLKQGEKPRGILASGVVMSSPHGDHHWDGTGAQTTYVDVDYDHVLDPDDVLATEVLQLELPATHWRPQRSETAVRREEEPVLDRLWLEHLESLGRGR
jgi:5-methylcytosine-specific restriction protein A